MSILFTRDGGQVGRRAAIEMLEASGSDLEADMEMLCDRCNQVRQEARFVSCSLALNVSPIRMLLVSYHAT